MQHAERQAVVFGVGTAGGVPFDMGSVQRKIRVAELAVEAAEGATVFVDADDGVAEGGISVGATLT